MLRNCGRSLYYLQMCSCERSDCCSTCQLVAKGVMLENWLALPVEIRACSCHFTIFQSLACVLRAARNDCGLFVSREIDVKRPACVFALICT